MRIVLASVISTKAATTRTTIRVTIENPLFEYERGRADLGHFHARARLERLPLEERARRPFLASDPDASAVDINSLEHHRLRADKGGGPRTDQRRHVDVALRDRPQERERRERDRDEDDQLQDHSTPDARCHGGADRRQGDRPEEEHSGRHQLPDGEKHRRDQPDDEARHIFNCEAGPASPSAAGSPPRSVSFSSTSGKRFSRSSRRPRMPTAFAPSTSSSIESPTITAAAGSTSSRSRAAWKMVG